MKVTLFEDGYRNIHGTVTEFETFEDFAKLFQKPDYGKPKDGSYFVRGSLKEGTRKDSNLETLELLIIDGDSSIGSKGVIVEGAPPALKAHELLKSLHINHFIYSSYSHGKLFDGQKVNKWRCVIPIERDENCDWANIDLKQTLKSNVSRVIGFFQQNSVPVAPVSENNVLSQPWYFPRFEHDRQTRFRAPYEFYQYHAGDCLVADDEPLNEIEVSGEEIKGQDHYERQIMDLWDSIYEGNTFHVEVRDLIYGKVRDGLPRATVIADMIAGLRSSKARDESHPNHHKWEREMSTLTEQVDEAMAKFRPKSTIETVELLNTTNRFTAHQMPSGVIGELAEEVLETMTFPNQEIAILAARHIVCTIAGRKCSIGSTKLDLSNVLVAEQATGKNTPNYCLSLILDQLKPYLKTQYLRDHCTAFKGSKGTFGIKGLYLDMARSPSVSIIIPEAGERYKSKTGDSASVKSFTMQMQSSPAHIAIDMPTYSEPLSPIYGVVTSKIEESNLESYRAEFSTQSVESGELARKLVHFASHAPTRYNTYKGLRHHFSEKLLAKLANIVYMAMDGENYEYQPDESRPHIGPSYKQLDKSKRLNFVFTDEAEALFDTDHKLEHDYRMQADPKEDPMEWALMGRRKQKIMREALLYAVADWAGNNGYLEEKERLITKEHYLQASAYIDECSRGLLANSDLFVGDTNSLLEELMRIVTKNMEGRGSAAYMKHHTAKDLENKLISHTFLMSGNSPFRYAIGKYIMQKNLPFDIAYLCKRLYTEGEDLGYWIVLDGNPAKKTLRETLGLRNSKKYLQITSVVSIKDNQPLFKAIKPKGK